MKRLLLVAGLTPLLLTPFVGSGDATVFDSCGGGCPKPPSNSREVSDNAVSPQQYPGNTLTARLAKGKKKMILVVEGAMGDDCGGGSMRGYGIDPIVNGAYFMNGAPHFGGSFVEHSCFDGGDFTCYVTAHWWLDMDDPANAALIGVPITVVLRGGEELGNPPCIVGMNLKVRLEKK